MVIVVDDIVECICLFGCFVFGIYYEFLCLIVVNEDKDILVVKNMIENFVQGQEIVVKIVCFLFLVVNNVNDEVIVDLFI